MNKRKLLTLAMTLCMVAILAIGGTLAYFTDSEKAKNTMVLGNVQIDIDEYTYMDENGDGTPEWDTFDDDEFVLYPQATVDGAENNNKMVYTANVSSSKNDAYIRNIVLFEANDMMGTVNKNEMNCCFPGMHFHYHNGDKAVSGTDGKTYYGSKCTVLPETVTIYNEKYWVAIFEEKNEDAIPYDAALFSLSDVHLDKNVTSAQISGWGEDNKVDIIVFSQAIQTTDLDYADAMAALGEVNGANLNAWLAEANEYTDATWTTKSK